MPQSYPDGLGRHADILAGRSMLVRKTNPVPDRVRRARIPVRVGLEGIPDSPARCAASRCQPGCASRIACPTPIFTPATKAESGHDINISEAEAGRSSARISIAASARADAGALRARRCARRVARHHPGRHQVRVRPHADTGDIILIDEVMTPDSSRYWPRDQYEPGRRAAELRQAVRARLPRGDPLEQAAAGAVAARRRGAADAGQVPRGVSPPHWPGAARDAAEGTARTPGRRDGDARASATKTPTASSRRSSSATS